MPAHLTRIPSQPRPTVLACSILTLGMTLAGCGGGTGDNVSQTDSGYLVESGVVQKGPLTRGSSISINEIDSVTLAPLGTSYDFEIRDDFGTFQPTSTVFKQKMLQATAMGYYLDELTGKISSSTVTLRGMSDLGVDRAINVNILTDLSNARIRALMTRATSPLSFAAARLQAQREVLAAFSIYNSADLFIGGTQPAHFGELDLSKKREADQILAALSAVVTQIGGDGGGVSQFLNRFESDLADDGLINNSTKFATPLTTSMNQAAQAVNFDLVAANLNAFYGSTLYSGENLSRWVDASGGTDRVINRYKSAAKDVAVGTESRSVAYVIGSEDANQCISASTGKLYRNGTLVMTPTIKAVKGESYTLGLTGATGTAQITGYIQRSAATAGVCPDAVPTTGLRRLARHTITLEVSANPSSILKVAKYSSYIYGNGVVALRGDGSIFVWNTNSRGIPNKLHKDPGIIDIYSSSTIVNSISDIIFKFKDGSTGRLTGYTSPYTMSKDYFDASVVQSCNYSTSVIKLKSNGDVFVSGGNTYGELGDGTKFPIATEKKIGSNYSKIICIPSLSSYSNNNYNTIGLKSDGTVWGWGTNLDGILGQGDKKEVLQPKIIDSGYKSLEIRYGSDPFSIYGRPTDGNGIFGIKTNNELWSWGSGYVGTGIIGGTNTPRKVIDSVSEIKTSPEGVLAKKLDGTIYAWGPYSSGIGVNNITNTTGTLSVPVPVDPSFISIEMAGTIAFGVKKDGSTWGWSLNSDGQLGDGSTTPSAFVPKLIGTDYQKMFSFGDHVMAIKKDGTLWSWGRNTGGQLGDGTTTDRFTPKQVVFPE